MKIRVLIADDHAIVREGLKQILSEVPDMVVAGEAADGQEALERIRKDPWDIVLLDMSMPGKSGIELLKQIKSEYPKLPVLILSMHKEDQYAVRTLRAGASGYLTKESAPQLLVSAIRKVASGGRYISPSLAEKLLLDWSPNEDKPLHTLLSDREFQIFQMIVSGKSTSEIADELALSVKTVSTHKVRILQKMKMKNNTELVVYAMKYQLIDAEGSVSSS
jgi:two-component system invasion response regulator UvrY